jgi:oxaloacetate decarboxylase alpha subunit
MRVEDMLPIAEKLDSVGYFSLEMWGGATFDSCLRFLNEDPWERCRKLKKCMPKTPLQMLLRGQNLVGYRHYADDIVEHFVKKSADNGIDVFRIFDALNDFRNLETAMKTAKKLGKTVEGTISYTVSPVHNVDLYLKMAKRLEDMGSDILCLKDMAGLLTPQVTRELITGFKKIVKIPVHLHTHATTGLVGMNMQCAIDAGVDIVDAAISSLSMGTSQYATECLVSALKNTPRDTGLDIKLLHEIADYFKEVKKKYVEFESDFRSVDIKILDSQIPGGMISNLENQLREQNALGKLNDVLLEVPKVRKEMGYPPLVTPTSQIVGSQATLNVMMGERYKIISKETRECVLGKYGKLPGPIDPALLAKVVTETEKVIECRPADLLPPEWETVVKECGEVVTSEEDRLSYALFPKVALKFFENRGKPQAETPSPVAEKPRPVSAPAPTAKPASAPVNTEVPATAAVSGMSVYTVKINGTAYSVEISGFPTIALIGHSASSQPVNTSVAFESAPVPVAPPASRETLISPLPGTVVSYKCKVGDRITNGQTLAVIESMKMESEVKSHCDGIVQAILVKEGSNVQTGDKLLAIG